MMDYEVADDSSLSPGEMVSVSAGGRSILVLKHSDGTVSALEDRCSHADVKLSDGSFSEGVVKCFAHGAKFDAKSGKQLCMPAVTPVPSYPVTVKNGKIVVTI